jgi:hypothetical protein
MKPREPRPLGPVARSIALPAGVLEARLAMAMGDLQSAASTQRAIADALQEFVTELSTRTVPSDLRHLAGGLAANSTRASLNALLTRGAADTIATVAALLDGAT